jgi:hypothetical protein
MSKRRKLPDGYRIERVMFGGTGNGDEQFTLELSHWETWSIKRRFHQTITLTGWRAVTRAAPYDRDGENFLIDFAHRLEKHRVKPA